MTGTGTIFFRADEDLVARVIAEKRRRLRLPIEGEGFRVVKQRARGRG